MLLFVLDAEIGTGWDRAGFQITPKRDRQLAGQGDDHDAPDAPLLSSGPVIEPLGRSAIPVDAWAKAMPLRSPQPVPADCRPWRCLGYGVRRRVQLGHRSFGVTAP